MGSATPSHAHRAKNTISAKAGASLSAEETTSGTMVHKHAFQHAKADIPMTSPTSNASLNAQQTKDGMDSHACAIRTVNPSAHMDHITTRKHADARQDAPTTKSGMANCAHALADTLSKVIAVCHHANRMQTTSGTDAHAGKATTNQMEHV